jgi:myo-inositol 2-dehydrogenase/D-chiro-inositol 1-dehydrogenase
MALACIESVKRGTPVAVNTAAVNTVAGNESAVL